MKPIGIVHSLFKEKFSIPRQPGLISIESRIELLAPFNRAEALSGLADFSHIWILFQFHSIKESEAQNLSVRPPRLGGNKKVGVFATRSPFRPNRLGLSLVKFERIEGSSLIISGGDLLDQTPVYDIKPYLKEIESVPDATSGWTTDLEFKRNLPVVFDCECDVEMKKQIIEILSLDPRPRYHEDGQKIYGSRLGNADVHWLVNDSVIRIIRIIQ